MSTSSGTLRTRRKREHKRLLLATIALMATAPPAADRAAPRGKQRPTTDRRQSSARVPSFPPSAPHEPQRVASIPQRLLERRGLVIWGWDDTESPCHMLTREYDVCQLNQWQYVSLPASGSRPGTILLLVPEDQRTDALRLLLAASGKAISVQHYLTKPKTPPSDERLQAARDLAAYARDAASAVKSPSPAEHAVTVAALVDSRARGMVGDGERSTASSVVSDGSALSELSYEFSVASSVASDESEVVSPLASDDESEAEPVVRATGSPSAPPPLPAVLPASRALELDAETPEFQPQPKKESGNSGSPPTKGRRVVRSTTPRSAKALEPSAVVSKHPLGGVVGSGEEKWEEGEEEEEEDGETGREDEVWAMMASALVGAKPGKQKRRSRQREPERPKAQLIAQLQDE